MQQLKLFAIDIDGVLLKDTFSPVLREIVLKHGGSYTAEIERNVFSRNQLEAASYLAQKLALDLPLQSLISEYFSLRDDYLKFHDGGLIDGALDMLSRLASFGIPMICYGGLERSRIDVSFAECEKYLDRYICTNEIRPGMKEICAGYRLKPSEVLFVDDVATVAETCHTLEAGFVGLPPSHAWGWQRQAMQTAGVRYCLTHPDEITHVLIEEIDRNITSCFYR